MASLLVVDVDPLAISAPQGNGHQRGDANTLSLFPIRGMLPCNHVLIGWLHQLPSEQQPSPSFTEQWPSWYARYDHEYFYRAYLCTHADGDSYLN